VFGAYRQVLLVYTTLYGVLSLQLEKSLFYFVPRADPAERGALVTQTLTLALAMGGGVGLVMFAGAGTLASLFDAPGLEGPIRIFGLFPISNALLLAVSAYWISSDRAIRGSLYQAGHALLRVAIVLSGFVRGLDLQHVFSWLVFGSAGLALVGVADVLRSTVSGPIRFERSRLGAQLGYVVPLWLTSLAGVLNLQFDKLLISAAFDSATYAVYFCGAMELPVVMLVTSSLTTAVMPDIVSHASQGRMRDALHLWQEATRKISLAVLPCFALFLAVAPLFIEFLYGEDYARATGPFTIYLLVLPLRVAVYGTLLRAVGETRILAFGALLALFVNVPVSTLLVWAGRGSELAFVGPAIGTVVATLAAASFLLWNVRRAVGVPLSRVMRWRELLAVLAVCGVAGGVARVAPLPPLETLVELVARGLVFLATLIALGLATGILNEDERELLRAPLRRLYRRRGP
jgi:O-antigen/teichoic acid export membrane protein